MIKIVVVLVGLLVGACDVGHVGVDDGVWLSSHSAAALEPSPIDGGSAVGGSAFTMLLNGASGQPFSSQFTRSSGAPGSVLESTGATGFVFQLPLHAGDVPTAVIVGAFRVYGIGGIAQARVDRVGSDGSTMTLGSVVMTHLPSSGAWIEIPISISSEPLGARDSLWLVVQVNAGGIAIGNISIAYDRK